MGRIARRRFRGEYYGFLAQEQTGRGPWGDSSPGKSSTSGCGDTRSIDCTEIFQRARIFAAETFVRQSHGQSCPPVVGEAALRGTFLDTILNTGKFVVTRR